MSVNGIVRRMDELGRIVIPKEIRRTLRLREGDEMEIVAEGDQLVLRKYSQLDDFTHAAAAVCRILSEYTSCEALVVTTSDVLEASGRGRKTLIGQRLSSAFAEAVLSRRESGEFYPDGLTEEGGYAGKRVFAAVCPVVTAGDLLGAVVAVCEDKPDPKTGEYLKFAAGMLAAVLDE